MPGQALPQEVVPGLSVAETLVDCARAAAVVADVLSLIEDACYELASASIQIATPHAVAGIATLSKRGG